ncbi:meiotic recombination protein [Ophidiomyces ophidiicola]|uniref:Meiotic recombination protein n=1 Tax=Ophidiomyces ophidiicola TaxID=1387563 RepID=A0ACB8UP94_9EURO|nr:meiotic recombination protein [Ophidiomyces ophidiicola]KAI1906819.1 meiotic recombination protein [Ophidiomyces ophidiicola]KAI1921358.1 meiotic recombination protein [Ophidiomyces ophidiicola]KAI1938337.1 meiotic recombination protein [Ophidiomyces ophidiicola]KAI1948894.1 meiotic recombination protein [Ophidiomyces ophidiicola]
MPLGDADTIRILVSTDNHVGYNERDPVRGDDSWKSFHEVMCLAKDRDVDMVLLAGDLFHDNKPSRKSMYQVIRSLRMNCYGDKPCELELLSDASENFQGPFNHVNYEDLDINIAIPVFSIHGNHDDPSGEGHLAALDILQASGLLNYYGRTPESDNIQIKPVLLQKGRTKLALYGMSNVRDERLFRTFRDGKVKFFRPTMQQSDWFNLMSVHQNHHARTETGYLPETFLPDFMDLVVWGHEHECLINPRVNPETKFQVMQPGSSVATSLVPGEAVPKHVAILSITGREFKCEPIRLKTVRPFVMRDIILHDVEEAQRLARKENHRTEITRLLMKIVYDLIEEARDDWLASQDDFDCNTSQVPLPLIRLRVETSIPEGGSFDCENPQRFSNRFVGHVANVHDVVQFYRKKKSGALSHSKTDVLDESVVSHLASLDTIKVERLVREFLAAQSLTILPQNSFGDAVSLFVDKDDKHAMEIFLNESLESQMKHLMDLDRDNDASAGDYDDEEMRDNLHTAMDKYREQLEELFSKGKGKQKSGNRRYKPKPDGWESGLDGPWEDQPGALIRSDHEDDLNEDMDEDEARPTARTRAAGAVSTRGTRGTRGSRGRGGGASRAKPSSKPARGRGRQAVSDKDDGSQDIVMLDDVDEVSGTDADSLFVQQSTRKPRSTTTASRGRKTAAASTRKTATSTSSSRGKQSQSMLTFGRSSEPSQSQTIVGTASTGGRSQRPTRRAAATKNIVTSDIEDDDEDDAFEPV